MFAEFVLTDGTTTLDLLGLNGKSRGPYGITRYTPGRPNVKGGGSWQDSPQIRGRRLVFVAPANINDAIELKIAGSHGELIRAQQELDLLLEQAIAYWTTDWQDAPVYIRARAAGEENPRYAVIYYAAFPEYPDPYHEPFVGTTKRFVMDGIILGIERGPWLATAPGVATAVAISHADADTSVYVGNGRSTGITQIRGYRNVPTEVWTGNLLDVALPYALFDQDGLDAWNGGSDEVSIYFGSPYPFASVVFDIGTAGEALILDWEISDGLGGWTNVLDIGSGDPVYLRDETNVFTEAGVHIVQWYDTFNFLPQALSTFGTLYWIRATLSGTDVGTLTAPTQQNRQPYTAKIPYIEVAATQIDGDINALAALLAATKSRVNDEIVLAQNFMIGLRSLVRNGLDCSDFSAYINMRTADNPGGVTIDLTGPTTHANIGTEEGQSGLSATGYYISYSGDDADVMDEVLRITIDTSVVRQYYGRYRLLVKTSIQELTAESVKFRSRVKFENANNELVGATVIPTASELATGAVFLVDFGFVQIPPTSEVKATEASSSVSIILDSVCATGESVFFLEAILLPADEASLVAVGTTSADTGDFTVDIDSIAYPKSPMRAILRDPDTLNIIDSFQVIGGSEFAVPTNVAFRLWFVQKNVDAHYGMAALVSLSRQQRYHHLRGD